MEPLSLAAIVLGLAALASVFNARVLRLPETIGLMATGLIASVAFIAIGKIFPETLTPICHQIASFDFGKFVLTYALGFLIFAGAFSADSEAMQRDRWPILVFATVGILLSTFIVGGISFGMFRMLGMDQVPFIHCLLFGALISPTDPIAVLAILKETSVPRSLRADIAGESLLNDGVAVVVFLTILQIAGGGGGESGAEPPASVVSVMSLLGREVFGGVLLGGVMGLFGAWLVRLSHHPAVGVLVSVAAVTGGYAIAQGLHVSGPLAMVVVGLVFGRQLSSGKGDESTRMHLESFWNSLEHLLNAVLFTLMGVVLLALSHQTDGDGSTLAALLAIPAVLLARVTSVAISLPLTKLRCGTPGSTIAMLSWGGLRGGISIALALSLPDSPSKNLILQMTFAVVAFSIIVQGLTISKLVEKLMLGSERGRAS